MRGIYSLFLLVKKFTSARAHNCQNISNIKKGIDIQRQYVIIKYNKEEDTKMEFTYLEFGMMVGLCIFCYWLGGINAIEKMNKKFVNREMR